MLWANRSASLSGGGGGAFGRRRLGIGRHCGASSAPISTCPGQKRSAKDQHDDDDEEDEADEAPADVDTGCEQHGIGTTPMGDTANTLVNV